MTKARFTMRCECCRSRIEVGSTFAMYAGRPWKTQHLVEYKRNRAFKKQG